MPTINLSAGPLSYGDTGDGPTLLFIHGYLVNEQFWRNVVPHLSTHFRCITPTLPLGAHTHAMSPDAALTPQSVAALIAEFMTALDLRDVTLVGCDTGGALCQLVLAHHPERLSALVLTNCDAYENFFPLLLRPLQWSFLVPGMAWLLVQLLRTRLMQWILLAPVAHNLPPAAVRASYFTPSRQVPAVRHDMRRFGLSVNNRDTIAAAQHFKDVTLPVLLVWGEDDILFPMKYAERLYADFPNATLQRVPDSRAFMPEDQPDVLAQAIVDFFKQPIVQ